MAAEDVQVQQNVASGPGSDLPQGAASALNALLPNDPGQGETLDVPVPPAEGAPAEEAAGAEGEAAEEDVPVMLAEPGDFDPDFEPETEDQDFITSPTLRPDEAQTAGTAPRRVIADSVRRQLVSLQAAATEADASPELRTIVAFLLREAK